MSERVFNIFRKLCEGEGKPKPYRRSRAAVSGGLAAFCLGFALWASSASAGPITAVYAFGDSLTDTGNIHIASQGLLPVPTGRAHPVLGRVPPALRRVLPDYFLQQHYYEGRFSNGPLHIEHVAEAFGTDARPFLAGGTNFAFAGDEIVDNRPPGLPFQVGLFRAALAGAPADPDALYVVWGGGNDIRSAYQGDVDPEAFAAVQMAGLYDIIARLNDLGAKRLLVPNLADVGQIPEARASGPEVSQRGTALTAAFNRALDGLLNRLEAERPIDLIRLDVAALFEAARADPGQFGLTNVTDACYSGSPYVPGTACATPETYVYWDQIHPTASAHRIVGQAAIAAVRAALFQEANPGGSDLPAVALSLPTALDLPGAAVDTAPVAVAEPASLSLVGAGMIALAALLGCRNRSRTMSIVKRPEAPVRRPAAAG